MFSTVIFDGPLFPQNQLFWYKTYNNASFYRLEQKLDEKEPFKLNVLQGSGKIEISLKKSNGDRWQGIGEPLTGNQSWVPEKELPTVTDFPAYRPWKLLSKTKVTRDVNHYVFEPCNQVKYN